MLTEPKLGDDGLDELKGQLVVHRGWKQTEANQFELENNLI